ncbi:polyadenylate-binding protein-interacting protein 1 [Drosophila ficusphila]|uniref:polyadenylate-binding protein-interacting protein 1 n=1 Tax=Drosophila ficusphila TaxID=30025 RepID=UPI0007E817B4|nr:polyadenylate-binding protein-interacting protein 1 [Drosophila ficusphila]XP_017049736.1 polyadenylate-binding protein-interacting protein 1 [Drosophila ficusphila]
MSCRAPFQPDDQYEQLRRPNAGGTGGVGMPGLEQQAHLFGDYGGAQGYGQAQVAGGYQQQMPVQAKLSASASVFIPQGSAPQQQQQARHQQYQQAGGAGGSGGGASYGQQQQQRYVNGYRHHHQQQHHQQPHYNHHHNHQQKFNNDMQKLTNSVQNRLQLNSQQGSAGNYYQQQQVHQQNTHHHHQQQHYQQPHQPHNQHAKFQRHTHLNNSFQQIAQQTQHHQQHSHQQEQYFQNQNQQQQPSTSSAAASSSSSNSSQPDMATIALEYLDTVIHCLNQNPGQFDTIASRFLTIFEGMENNDYVLSIAMEDIFEKSIEQSNFRYMGAKLYNLLHMLNAKPDSLFNSLLKCKLEYHQKEVTKYMSNEQQKVRETALFLAELYMQLRGDDDSRIQLIAENIVYSLGKLLQNESKENVRCICQTLKLAGYDLTADCAKDMQEIIAALQAIELNSPGKHPMAASVIALQQNNWGRKVSNALGGDEDLVPEPPRLSDEPVFYGPDGRELTAEETDFLAAEDGGNSDGDDFDGDGGELEMDAEMDEETERAYKEFCKQKT